MTSQNNNRSGSREIQREPPHAPRTLGDKGAKILVDAQRMAKATSGQKPSRFLHEGGDKLDITIKRLQTQLVKITQSLVDNRLMKPVRR